MKKLLFFLLFFPILGFAQQVSLVKDFNDLSATSGHDPEPGGIVYNGKFIYAASSASSGVEPWLTDGNTRRNHFAVRHSIGRRVFRT